MTAPAVTVGLPVAVPGLELGELKSVARQFWAAWVLFIPSWAQSGTSPPSVPELPGQGAV